MTGGQERGLWLDAAHRADLATFVERAHRLDDAAVIRLRQRADGLLTAWTATGFDVLASRVVRGRVRPADLSAGADALIRGLAAMDASGYVDPGFPMDAAWRGALPPESGFVHLDDLPARAVLDLASRGVELSKEHGAQGPPVSLLDQEVIRVDATPAGPPPSDDADASAGIPMRCVFALTAMGFVAPDAADEIVRVRVLPAWLRIDARFGSVYRRRGDPLLLM
jgi:hypothetical protein